jgi:RNA polymerase sigma-B factor
VDERLDLRDALDAMPAAERDLVDQYFIQGRSQSQLAAEHGVSQMSISRRLARSVDRLRSVVAT